MQLKGDTLFSKVWYGLRRYVLVLRIFDLFLQGAFLVVIMLETNALLLLRRDAASYVPSLTEDWVIIAAGGVEFLLGAAVAWWGGGRRPASLSAALAGSAAVGLVVLAFPFSEHSLQEEDLCGSEFPVASSHSAWRTATLAATAVLCTLAKVTVWAHGLTYIDDHDPKSGPYYYGILISIRMSLGLGAQGWLQGASRGAAWWQPQLSLSLLVLMFAVLFALFPNRMQDFPEPQVDTDFFSTMDRLRSNRPLVLQTLALSLLSLGVFGFVHYDRAYVQARFSMEAYRQDPQTSRALSDIYRSLLIIFFVMIFRVRYSVSRTDGVKWSTAAHVGGVTAAFTALVLAALAAISCDSALQGGLPNLQCSGHCGCNSEQYGMSPVCDPRDSVTYYSPCHAGCNETIDLNGFLVFQNCSCGGGSVVRGACSVAACRTAFSAYQVLFTVMLAVAASSFLMQGMSVLRSVARADKPAAVGASFAVVAFFTYVLGHLMYMGISYLACAQPGRPPCALHGRVLWSLVATSAALAAASAALSLLASKQPPPEPTTEL